MAHFRTLMADDDPVICTVLTRLLVEMGHEVDCVHTAAAVAQAVQQTAYDLVLLDLYFPDCRDLSTLAQIRSLSPQTDVIIVTAESDDLEIVAEAVKLGAFDYIPKPVRDDDIRIRVTRLEQMRSLTRRSARAIGELSKGRRFEDIVANSLAIRSLVRQAKELAEYDAPVLIVGETGTGKELIARALHYGGLRRDRPFVVVNCAAIPTELTESELFGRENGAHPGSPAGGRGAFDEAEDGTLFLDEIGDMNPLAQASLLHVLERGTYRTGGGVEKETSARVVFATNQDLGRLMSDGTFRKDLYYRISRIRLNVPPLRERLEDIPVLAEYLLQQLDGKVGKRVRSISPDGLAVLQAYDWPGNVRELKNEIEQGYLRAEGDVLTPVDLSSEILAARATIPGVPQLDQRSSDDMRRLVAALKESHGNLSKAASMLGIHRNTAWRWMKKYALERPRSVDD